MILCIYYVNTKSDICRLFCWNIPIISIVGWVLKNYNLWWCFGIVAKATGFIDGILLPSSKATSDIANAKISILCWKWDLRWYSEMANCKPNFGLELRPRLNSHQLSHDDEWCRWMVIIIIGSTDDDFSEGNIVQNFLHGLTTLNTLFIAVVAVF